MTTVIHLGIEDRKAIGMSAREQTPRSSHTGWTPAPDRPDPIALLEAQNATREPDLVPVRHGRMMVSPFTFYRGAAKIMATDLKDTPSAGLIAQLCGDAHLSNFGLFASPERTLVFDLNDFDETLPGPFEYDVKRMAASFTIAGRNNSISPTDSRTAALTSAAAYHAAMIEFAQMPTMDIWHARFSEQDLMDALANSDAVLTATKKAAKRAERFAEKTAQKAHARDSLSALSKLAELVDGEYRIVSQPPIVIPAASSAPRWASHPNRSKRRSMASCRRIGRRCKTTGASCSNGSSWSTSLARSWASEVSDTRAYIALLQGRDQGDPLFLQVKEATESVLEDHLPKSQYEQPGERVVRGQRMMQAASDIFLGWTKGAEENRYLYWRQLRDMKGSIDVELMLAPGLAFYARICGQSLARSHARSGDPVAMAAYLGKKDRFEESIADFAERYADQNERDYDAFLAAIKSGRLEALEGV